MTGPDDREQAGPEPDDAGSDEADADGGDVVDEQDQPVSLIDDAIAEAFGLGLRVTRPDDGPWRGLVCAVCGESFDIAAVPVWPRRVARRIRAFVVRHQHGEGD